MAFIKEGIDYKVEQATKDFGKIVAQMPTFFRETKTVTSNKEPELLKKDANGDEWRKSLLNTQLDIKALFVAYGDTRQAFMEVFRKTKEIIETLKEGYDIQGRAMVAICKKLGISFDTLIELYAKDEAQSDEDMELQISAIIAEQKSKDQGNLPF